jgi:hypothetical protein
MATTCCTSGWRGQKLNDIIALQGKLLTLDKEEDGHTRCHLFFLFCLFSISPFYHKCNTSPTLENYKRGGRGHLTKTTDTPR